MTRRPGQSLPIARFLRSGFALVALLGPAVARRRRGPGGRTERQHGLGDAVAGRRPVPAAAERAVARRLDPQPAPPVAGRQRLPDGRPSRPTPGCRATNAGDAWLGLFKSFDGGRRGRAPSCPGYPQDRPRGPGLAAQGPRRRAPIRRSGRASTASSTTAASRSTAGRTSRRVFVAAVHRQQQQGERRRDPGQRPDQVRRTRVIDTGTRASSSTSPGSPSTSRARATRPARSRPRRTAAAP